MAELLRVDDLHRSFQRFPAVRGASLSVHAGEVVAVIGPNGAGKTTLFNLVTGVLRPDRGRVVFGGVDVTRWPAHRRCRAGVGRTFQIANVFSRLSVFENVHAACLAHARKGFELVRPASRFAVDQTREILEVTGLHGQSHRLAGTLSHGDQRILEIALALASRPRLLVLDEPTAGMSPEETASTLQLITRLNRERGLSVLFCEHDMEVVFSTAHRVVVMHQGRTIAAGSPDQVRADPEVQRAYLGGEEAEAPAVRSETAGRAGKPLLQAEGLHTYYGLSHVLFDVSLQVREGEAVFLLGRNGAGKSTTLKSVVGLVPPRRGAVRYRDRDVVGLPPHTVARLGAGYVPDDRRIFPDLTVWENLEVAARGQGYWTFDRVFELFPVLREKRHHRGSHLSGGEQKMLAIARALVGNPDLLLLDEPMEGLAPRLVRVLEDRIRQLKATGLTVLLAEQNVGAALRLADRGYVIDDGRIRFEGTVEALQANHEVRRRYLLL
ncbi:MAG: ATP-binding cassette domain-containing protein [Armatimonadota bacterium]|nr:ATP-binding cassette domain-containing protein [Armatimonadota bacterium]MDR7460677.1 ATP-binding cassette domain-containing protein [Armatimonadota bacterium]MDR7480237.1 ATP-binding cassette domain-containing protein [Armatimonadota bacterium]MDR7489612.1 ATP-binding cassette domain-containing protein [Armatimonadota bacterium]MDR7502766.1 ATP-binding cassette domain-containing protein [Armatimonadota bacterium]